MKSKQGNINKDILPALFFLLPSLGGFLLFYLIPFLSCLYYSLLSSPIRGRWVGLSNYIQLIGNPIFRNAFFNTLIFTLISVPLIVILSLLLALFIDKNIFYKNIYRTVFITPLVVPVASVALIWRIFFDSKGIMNGFCGKLGIQEVDWFQTPFARIVVMVVYVWKNAGYNMVLFLAGLKNIPVQFYEAARIEGAKPRHLFFRITWIYLTPTSFFVFIISIINSFKVFRETYLLAGPYPHSSIYMLQHYMNNTFRSLDYQKLTSGAVIMAIFISCIVYLLFSVEKRIGKNLS